MYLTKINHVIDHRSVMRGFPETQSGTPRSEWKILFRHDGDATLIQSAICPDYSRIISPDAIQQREFMPSIVNGASYRFRLAIAAVKRQSRTGRDLLVSPDEWLEERSIGATIDQMSAVHSPVSETSGSHQVYVNRWHIDGILTVDNPSILESVITAGIGRCRAWGCGLLSAVPTHSANFSAETTV